LFGARTCPTCGCSCINDNAYDNCAQVSLLTNVCSDSYVYLYTKAISNRFASHLKPTLLCTDIWAPALPTTLTQSQSIANCHSCALPICICADLHHNRSFIRLIFNNKVILVVCSLGQTAASAGIAQLGGRL